MTRRMPKSFGLVRSMPKCNAPGELDPAGYTVCLGDFGLKQKSRNRRLQSFCRPPACPAK
jgi:hypothetical protein